MKFLSWHKARRNSWRHLPLVLVPVATLLLLAGCEEEAMDTERAQVGVVVDAPVRGLRYAGGGFQGETDTSGRFSYIPGRTYAFSLGRLELGRVDIGHDGATITPGTLMASFPVSQRKAAMLGLTRFLMTADLDANPDNGIRLFSLLDNEAQAWGDIPVSFVLDLAGANAQTVLAGIRRANDNATLTYVTELKATEHLQKNMACSYSGAFYGVLPNDDRLAFVQAANGTLTAHQYSPKSALMRTYAGSFSFTALEADTALNRVALQDEGGDAMWLRYSHDIRYPDYVGVGVKVGATGSFPELDRPLSRLAGQADATQRFAGIVRSSTYALGRDYVFVVETHGQHSNVGSRILSMQTGAFADLQVSLSKGVLTASAELDGRKVILSGNTALMGGAGSIMRKWTGALTEEVNGLSFSQEFVVEGCLPTL